MKLKSNLCGFLAALALLPVAASAVVSEGRPAPRVTMELLKDGVVSGFPGWKAYKGKVVVLELWSTGCSPCVAGIPRMNDLQKKLEGKPIVFLSVTAESADVINKFLKTHPMSGVLAVNGESAIKALGTGLYPQTVLISKTGKVLRYTRPEELSVKALAQLLNTGSVSGIARVLPDKNDGRKAGNPPLFEVQVSSAPDNAGISYGRGAGNLQVMVDYNGLPLRMLLAKVYGVAAALVEVSSGVPQLKFNFAARVPKEAESTAKPLLKEAIKAAYRAEVRSVKKEMQVLVMRHAAGSAHAGLLPSQEGGTRRAGSGLFQANGARLADLSEALETELALPVIDETGLNGTYDMDLEWKAGDKDSLAAALKERFGITLAPASREVEILEVFPAGAADR